MTEPPVPSFGEQLRGLRAGARLTQEELACAAGMRPQTVSDIERGEIRRPRRATVSALAEALGLRGAARQAFEAAARGRGVSDLLAGQAEVRYSLPPDVEGFGGRAQEIAEIMRAPSGGVVTIRAVTGMPGVGKTALALHAAHGLRGSYPDRQLFVDLHAHTPGRPPADPAEALAGLLAAAGVSARELPEKLADRTALWRDRMADQRLLLVLDNAESTSQVTPLLPGGRRSLVLVTSRRLLGDLPGVISPVELGALAPAEAAAMFLRLAPRAAAGLPSEVEKLTELAGYLPLAVSLLARLYARHREWNLADLTAETERRLLDLAAEKDSVGAAFELSYQYLAPGQQQLFRLLGLHPGTTADGYAAAALAGLPLEGARRLLDDLHGEGLLTETGYYRYRMHDLIRQYARVLARADPAAARQAATDRLLDYYQGAADGAEDLLARYSRPARRAATRVPPGSRPPMPDRLAALAWARAERGNLLACLGHAARAGQDGRVTAMTAAMAGLLRQDGPWKQAAGLHAAAAAAARRAGDRGGEAAALVQLAALRSQTGAYAGAVPLLEAALGISRESGDAVGQANALCELALARQLTGDYPAAAAALDEALALSRGQDAQLTRASALTRLASLKYLVADYPAAAACLQEAEAICGSLRNDVGLAAALTHLGAVRFVSSELREAEQTLLDALGKHQAIGDRQGEANTLNYLGAVWRYLGNVPGALQAHEEALDIYTAIGDRAGQANALVYLGPARRLDGDTEGAAIALTSALDSYAEAGNQLGRANALSYLASVHLQAGRYGDADKALGEALALYARLEDRGGEAEALNVQGSLRLAQGLADQAAASHETALCIAGDIASRLDKGDALAGLGRCALAAGNLAQARSLLEHALGILEPTGSAGAAVVAADLSRLRDTSA